MDFRSRRDVRASDDIREELLEFVQSQYSASPNICGILETFRSNISPRADIDLFYDVVFNIISAQGVGLDLWGNIVHMKRSVADPDTGFMMALSDEGYRTLLLYKALANIMDATAASLNRLIHLLFPGSICYVLVVQQEAQKGDLKYNARPMHIRWVLEHFLSDEERAIFKVAGTLCKGAGVGWSMYNTDPDRVFGFDGGGWQPFDQACFDPYGLMEGE